ncbi:MAG: FkbM family methyltransferase [Flavobacteriales bacterium]
MTKHKDLIFDVGLHKGEDTGYYLRKGFKVVAFEADPDLIKSCKQKFAKEISSGQLRIVEGAIVENIKAGDVVRFYKNNKNTVWGTVVQDWSERNVKLGAQSEVIEVKAIDFAECLRLYGIPYYMKIDIEGMDTVCLKSLLHFDNKPDYISIESDKVSMDNIKAEFQLFDALGYNAFQIVNQGNITRQKEKRENGEGKFLGHYFEHGSTGPFGKDLGRKWLNKNQAISKYESIFIGYKLWGDHSKIKRFILLKILRRMVQFLTRNATPGWYDTHARHSNVNS